MRALPLRTGVTFNGQNNPDNSRRCDTRLHTADIVVFFGDSTINAPGNTALTAAPHGLVRHDGNPYSQLSCASYYLSYRSRADGNILFTIVATALASIRRRVCSH
jgi:hypothetical protein